MWCPAVVLVVCASAALGETSDTWVTMRRYDMFAVPELRTTAQDEDSRDPVISLLDPCKRCGPNTECNRGDMIDLSRCSCKPGFTGEPLKGCTPIPVPSTPTPDVDSSGVDDTPHDPCSICGANTDCSLAQNQIPLCSCKPGFTGEPLDGCRPKAECSSHSDCSSERACLKSTCVDPCINACGDNTHCRVVDHVAACSCVKGFVRNTLPSCIPPPSDKIMKKYYYLSDTQANWTQAVELCHKRGMKLASIESLEEHSNAVALIKAKEVKVKDVELDELADWWTSGVYVQDSNYVWLSAGTTFGYTNWADRQPTKVYEAKKENCIELWAKNDYKWNDQSCDSYNKFVCEYYESV